MAKEHTMRLGEWITTLIVIIIPILNIIMLILWALDKENPRNKFSKAYMIVTGSAISISFIAIFIMNLDDIENSSTEKYIPSYEHYEYTNRASDLEITEIEFLENFVDTSIHGKVLNKSLDYTFENIAISGLVYDDTGSIIDSFIIFLNQIIPPGESYRFSDMGFSSDAHTIKIEKISHINE